LKILDKIKIITTSWQLINKLSTGC